MDAIVTKALVKRFGDVTAVDGVDLAIQEGELFGLLGPNGAGKTTTISILATLLKPTSGSAAVAGHDVVREPDAVRRSIGIVFQDPSLDEEMTGIENLRFHARLYKVPVAGRQARLKELLGLVELWDRRDDLVKTYSGGMRRRLELARGLVHAPRVLFLDEPTLGLDPQTRARLWDYIRRMNKEQKVTMVLTTHYMEEADSLCDRLAIIDRGKIVALDTPARLKAELGGDVLYVNLNGSRDAFLDTVRAVPGVASAKATDEGLMVEGSRGEELIPRVLDSVRARGGNVTAIRMQQPTLNDVFIKHTGRAIREETMDHAGRMRHYMRAHRRR